MLGESVDRTAKSCDLLVAGSSRLAKLALKFLDALAQGRRDVGAAGAFVNVLSEEFQDIVGPVGGRPRDARLAGQGGVGETAVAVLWIVAADSRAGDAETLA